MKKLFERTIFGLLYVVVIIAAVIIYPAALPFLGALVLGLMMREFNVVSLGDKFRPQRWLAVASAVLAFLAECAWLVPSFPLGDSRWLWLPLIPFLSIVPVQLSVSGRFELDSLANIFYSLIWIALPFLLYPFIFLRSGSYDGKLLMSFFILIWSSDVGAYCLGSLLGQRQGAKKLAPHISPNKSWWGVVGSIILCIASAFVLECAGWIDLPYIHLVMFAVIIAVASVVGDLFESLWKRYARIKDSGNLIPGHGGLLDRLDSSLFAIPAGALYLIFFNLI